jgi:hypothetical protein
MCYKKPIWPCFPARLLLLMMMMMPSAGQPLTEGEKECFRSYFYHIAAARGSGEFALRHLLAPGAWAHSPLQERLQELKVGRCAQHTEAAAVTNHAHICGDVTLS